MTSSSRKRLVVLGLLQLVLGAILIAQPFDSLADFSGLAAVAFVALLLGEVVGAPVWNGVVRITLVAWVAGAGLSATRPDGTPRELAGAIGLVLLVEGLVRTIGASRSPERRTVGLLTGLVGMLAGAGCLFWPDVTALQIGILLGLRLVASGAGTAWVGRRGTFDEAQPFEKDDPRRFPTATVVVLALVVSGIGAVVSDATHDDSAPATSFRPPKTVPKTPGHLVSAEPYTRDVPAGAEAWKIEYTTTREQGVPALSTGLIIVSKDRPKGPRPVIAWAHGTTGIATACAPTGSQDPVAFTSIPGLGQALDDGWAVVATDYIGLGTPGPHPYLIGQASGRAVLDSVRAAREFTDVSWAKKTVIWGHSQGGGAALWAGILAPTYAPGAGVIGVAAVAPASNLNALVSNIARYPAGALFAAYVLDAYATAYPDVDYDSYVTPAARAPLHRAAQLCLSDQAGQLALARAFDFRQPIYARDTTTGPLGAHLRANDPTGAITVPVFIGQGLVDPLVQQAVQTAYVAVRCQTRGNGPLDYRTYPDREHVNIVAADSPLIPDLLAWTTGRFSGSKAPSTC